MRQIKKRWVVPGVLVMLLVWYLIKDHYDEIEDDKRRSLFHQVKKGMSKEDVIQILGKPDAIRYDKRDSSFELDYFNEYYKYASDPPGVVFDSLSKVKYASFGD